MTTMKEIRIEKLTLNVGTGKDQNLLEKGMKLLKKITGLEPVKTITEKRIPSWGLRPGLPVGCKITLRNKEIVSGLVARFIKARGNKLPRSCFDKNGNVAFGIHEYIDVQGLDYEPQIGIIGFQACVTLERSGFSIKRKSYKCRKIGKKHLISQDDAIKYMHGAYGVEIEE